MAGCVTLSSPALSDSVTGTCVTRGLRLFIILLHRPDDRVFVGLYLYLNFCMCVFVYLCERQLYLFISLLHLTDNWEKPGFKMFSTTFNRLLFTKNEALDHKLYE